MKRRSAKFLGSAMWRSRDVSMSRGELNSLPAVKLTDVPSGISVLRNSNPKDDEAMARMYGELAHRVHQFE